MQRPRLIYIINLFPNLIETMIYREVEGLRARGYDIRTFSIRRPDDSLIPAESRHLVAETVYMLPVSPLRLLGSHVSALARFPRRYWMTLFEVLSGTHTRWRDRVRTLCHFAEAVTVLRTVERLDADHLHAHWSLGSTTCAMVLSRFLDIPFSFTAHAYDIWRERLLLPQKLRAATLTLTCTDYNRRHLIEAYGADPSKVRVVYHGLSVDQFSPRPRRANPVPILLLVGRLVEQKGFDRLLRACATLADEGLAFECRIVGDGPLRAHLTALTAELHLGDHVRFVGKLFPEALIEHYAAADLFALLCVPARDDDRDGIPNTLIEAMAMELPVLSTRFSGVPELVVEHETGLLVDTDDHIATVAALRALLRDPALRQRLGRAGRRRVSERFTSPASAAVLDETFTRVVAQRTTPRQTVSPSTAITQPPVTQ